LESLFFVFAALPCGDFPGPGSNNHRTVATFNPMREYIHNDDRHIDTHFEDFISAHNKKYIHDREATKRLNLFRHNFRFIESKNRQGLTYRLAINHLADRTDEERKVRENVFEIFLLKVEIHRKKNWFR